MKESPIFSRTYDLLLWLIPQAQKFPRAHRFGVGERVVRLALDFQEMIIAAGLSTGEKRRERLMEADIQLAKLRNLARLCKDMELVTIGQYEHAAKMLVEIGRLLGGWLKTAFSDGAG
jgi:hypothetical protein